MVLKIAEAFASAYFPTQYALHITVGLVTILVLRAFSQGRRTNRDRDLHARVVLVTVSVKTNIDENCTDITSQGGFTPLGLTILQSLAQRGAHVIALSSDPIDSANVTILISLLRTTTSNEQIFAEECDLSSPSSIRSFCTKFLTGKDQRLDAIIFAHENKHIGSPKPLSTTSIDHDQKERDVGSLATFLITTLLLPAVLVAPAERDIRIINVVNPFYAAAAGVTFSPTFTYETSSPKANSLFLREGHRALRTIVFTRHLQRVLDALPSASQVPKTEEGTRIVPVVSARLQKSNITAVSVSTGIGRVDTISSLLNADWTSPYGSSYSGIALYLFLQPLLRLFTKSPIAAMQTVLHVLFLPTPFKVLAQATDSASASTKEGEKAPQGPIDASRLEIPEEVLRPGSLYAECATVKLKVKLPKDLVEEDQQLQKQKAAAKEKKADKGKGKEKASLKEEVLDISDDGEYGGELGGRLVWEAYEGALKIWEKENPGKVEEKKAETEVPLPKPQLPKEEETSPY